MSDRTEADLYISVDIESDGPIPAIYSMLSFGLAVAGRFDGKVFEAFDPEKQTLYRELKPISERFLPDAVAVTGLDRDLLARTGTEPTAAMVAAKRWVQEQAGNDRPVLVGFPLVFDWLFFTWYLERFAAGSPFCYSSGLDMKTLYATKAQVPLSVASKDDLPSSLQSEREHTHNALDDAIEQAEIFAKLFAWRGER